MSKARLVITAIEIEGRTVADVVASYDVSRSWVYELLTRYRTEGQAALVPRSRRAHTSPTAITQHTVELIIELRKKLTEVGLDAGPDTIAWHLAHRHQIKVSAATISRTLTRQGLVEPNPKKRPKSSYIRFEAAMPNETWQSDFTDYRLNDAAERGPEEDTDVEDHLLARRPRPLRPARLFPHSDHRTDRCRHLHQHRRSTRVSRIRTHRQRARLHHPILRRPGRTQRPGVRTATPQHRPEEHPAQPPDHHRKGRAVPADHEEMAGRAARPAHHHPSTTGSHRQLPRRVQSPPAPPIAPTPSDPGHRLHRPHQSHPRR